MATTAVRVALRVKPLLSDTATTITFIKDEPQINFCNERAFTFDFVYPPTTTQEQLYSTSILPLLDRFTEGKNVTILAYGQTGSGKTYSMGTGIEPTDMNDQGIVHRFSNTLFDRMNNLEEQESVTSYQIYVSYLELYNEEINDLLNAESHATVREDIHGKIYWSGIKEERIYSAGELLSFLRKGSNSRTTGSTEMNTYSSRSHAIFSVTLKQQQKEDRLVSKFHFVDLAGSERLKRTHALGERQKEGIFINTGLLALGNVISALGDSQQQYQPHHHVPYRDSKLTRLLQDSLGGNSHTLMLACISGSTDDATETLNTLKYANRARNIQNRVEINLVKDEEELVFLRNQVSRLKLQLNMLKDVHQAKPEDTIKLELENVKSYALELSNELAKVKSQRDNLLLNQQQQQQQQQQPALEEEEQENDVGEESNPLILKYLKEIEALKWQVSQTQIQLDQSRLLQSTSRALLSTAIQPQKTSSVHFLKTRSGTATPHRTRSTGGVRRSSATGGTLNRRKFHVHRMKTNSMPSSTKRRSLNGSRTPKSSTSGYYYQHSNSSHSHKIENVLQLLNKEYHQETQKSTLDEQLVKSSKPTLKKDTRYDRIPDTPVSPCLQPTLNDDGDNDDDELEALEVPSWSNRTTSNNTDSIKRKSISVDSMWDDTDSSMTTPRHFQETANSASVDLHSSKSRDERRQNKNLIKMLHQIQADVLVKQELVGQLGKTEDEYAQMKETYEDRLKDLKGHLLNIQKQQEEEDAAAAEEEERKRLIAKKTRRLSGAPLPTLSRPQSVMQLRENRQAQEVRSQYEAKVKRLMTEIQDLRSKHTQTTQQLKTSRVKADQVVAKLRSELESLKLDKKQLLKTRKLESEKARESLAALQRELAQSKRREQHLMEQKKKMEQEIQSQKETVKKKSDELTSASAQHRQLTQVLRKAASEGVLLNEASLEKIMGGVVPKRPGSRAASAASSYLTD